MVKFVVKLSARLENIALLQPVDTAQDPFDYVFKISCVRCHEMHSKDISINRGETMDLLDSRGVANFIFKCKFCGNDSHASILTNVVPYTLEDSTRPKPILELEARGLVIEEFVPNGYFQAKSAESQQVFDEVELDDEWYDVDENTLNEVSITDIKWEVTR